MRSAVGVIGQAGGLVHVSPLRRQSHAVLGNCDEAAGIVDIAAGICPTHEHLSGGSRQTGGGGHLRLRTLGILAGVRHGTGTLACGIGHAVPLAVQPDRLQSKIFCHRRAKAEGLAVQRPSAKGIAIAGGHRIFLVNGRAKGNGFHGRNRSAAVGVKGHGKGLAGPLGIEQQVLSGHCLAGEAERVARAGLVVIPAGKVQRLAVHRFGGFSHLIAAGSLTGDICLIRNLIDSGYIRPAVGVKGNVVVIAGIVKFSHIAAARSRRTVRVRKGKAGKHNIVLIREGPSAAVQLERRVNFLCCALFVIVNITDSCIIFTVNSQIVLGHRRRLRIGGAAIRSGKPQITGNFIICLIPITCGLFTKLNPTEGCNHIAGIGMGMLFLCAGKRSIFIIAIIGIVFPAPPMFMLHFPAYSTISGEEGQGIGITAVIHIFDGSAIAGNRDVLRVGLGCVQLKAGIAFVFVGSFIAGLTGSADLFHVGIPVVVGIFLPVHHRVVGFLRSPLCCQSDVLGQLAAGKLVTGRGIPAIKLITRAGRGRQGAGGFPAQNIHRIDGRTFVGIKGNPMCVLHHRIQGDVSAVHREVLVCCGGCGVGAPAHQCLVRLDGVGNRGGVHSCAVGVFLRGNHAAGFRLLVEHIVLCVEARIQVNFLRLAYGGRSKGCKQVAALCGCIPTDKNLSSLRRSRRFGLIQRFAVLDDLLAVLRAVDIVGISGGGFFGNSANYPDRKVVGAHGDFLRYRRIRDCLRLTHGRGHGCLILHVENLQLAALSHHLVVGGHLKAHVHRVLSVGLNFVALGVGKSNIERNRTGGSFILGSGSLHILHQSGEGGGRIRAEQALNRGDNTLHKAVFHRLNGQRGPCGERAEGSVHAGGHIVEGLFTGNFGIRGLERSALGSQTICLCLSGSFRGQTVSLCLGGGFRSQTVRFFLCQLLWGLLRDRRGGGIDRSHGGNGGNRRCRIGYSTGITGAGVAGSGVARAGIAGSGIARAGVAGRGVARAGVAGSGIARAGVAGSGIARAGVAGSGVARAGVAGRGIARAGVAGSGITCASVAGSGIARAGVTGSGIARAGVAGSDIARAGGAITGN